VKGRLFLAAILTLMASMASAQVGHKAVRAYPMFSAASLSYSIDLRSVEFKSGHPSKGEDLSTSMKAPTAACFQILRDNVETLKQNPDIRIEIRGHAHVQEGSEAGRIALSERRAKLIYDYLIANGVPSAQVGGPKGFGSADPIDTNETEEGRQRNARVDFFM